MSTFNGGRVRHTDANIISLCPALCADYLYRLLNNSYRNSLLTRLEQDMYVDKTFKVAVMWNHEAVADLQSWVVNICLRCKIVVIDTDVLHLENIGRCDLMYFYTPDIFGSIEDCKGRKHFRYSWRHLGSGMEDLLPVMTAIYQEVIKVHPFTFCGSWPELW